MVCFTVIALVQMHAWNKQGDVICRLQHWPAASITVVPAEQLPMPTLVAMPQKPVLATSTVPSCTLE
jgi:hypothetical protein